jgi:hypothetical protein
MFDLEKIKRERGLFATELARLEEQTRHEFENEMFELRLFRVIKAIRENGVTFEGHYRKADVQWCLA